MMTKKLIPFGLLALAATLSASSGCKGQEGQSSDAEGSPTQVMARFQNKLDSSLSDQEREVLAQDGLALAQYKIDGAKSRWFGKLFGGDTSADVLGYLDDRVRHIYPERAPLSAFSFKTPSAGPTRATVFATNYGPLLWFEQLLRPDQTLFIQSNLTLVPLSESRVGVIKISPAYIDSAKPKKEGFGTSVLRTSILIHEARHSDCQGGLTQKDIDSIRNTGMPLNQSCAHLHGLCPASYDHPQIPASLPHPMAGELMCDPSPWGAYSVQLVFALALAKNCANCTEAEKQEALIIATDSFMRVSRFAMPMLKGERGEPDMTSQGFHP